MNTIMKFAATTVFLLAAIAGSAWAQGAKEVAFTTSDGVVIKGTLWDAGSGKPAVICLHQWRNDRASYVPLAQLLASSGFTVLTIDARGYGASQTTDKGGSVRPERDIQKDIQAAIGYINNTLKPAKIGLIGASYGSSNAVIFGASSADISALVLLSPGLNYFNELPTEGPVKNLAGKKVLAFASSEDPRSVEAVELYAKFLGDGISYKIYTGAGHGTDMLSSEKELPGLIKDFLAGALK